MSKHYSPYYRGAASGRWFGLYLSVIFLSMALSSYLPLLSLLTIGMMVSVPVYVYRALKKSHQESSYCRTIPELWVEGITMFLFATAICALVTIIYMKWISPGFLVEQVQQTITACYREGSPEYMELARVLSNMIKQGVVPSPSTFVISMFWLTMAAGCFLSLIIASVVKTLRPRKSGKVTSVNP